MRYLLNVTLLSAVVCGGPAFAKAEAWSEYRSESGRYVAYFPNALDTVHETEEQGAAFTTADIEGRPFGCWVKYAPIGRRASDVPRAELIDHYRKYVVNQWQGKIVSESPLTFGRHFGQEFRVLGSAPSGVRAALIIRFYFVDDRSYELMVNAPADEFPDPAAARRFFNSFWCGTPADWSRYGDNPPIVRPAVIQIHNPKANGVTMAYLIDGRRSEIAPGYSQELERESVIAFDRGRSKGEVKYTLRDGDYEFYYTDDGSWDLRPTK
jgi:hypothetical protein